jgi:hypothetical protein
VAGGDERRKRRRQMSRTRPKPDHSRRR